MNDNRHPAEDDRPNRSGSRDEDAPPPVTVPIAAPVPVSPGRIDQRRTPAPPDADEESIAGEEDPGAALDSLRP